MSPASGSKPQSPKLLCSSARLDPVKYSRALFPPHALETRSGSSYETVRFFSRTNDASRSQKVEIGYRVRKPVSRHPGYFAFGFSGVLASAQYEYADPSAVPIGEPGWRLMTANIDDRVVPLVAVRAARRAFR